VRSTILSCRFVLIGILAAGLVVSPAMAASTQPLATVVAADSAHLANANAVPGADVYLDDDLVTDPGGSLRLKVGQGQIYLLSESEAVLRQEGDKVRAKMYRGTLGFSTTAPAQIEVETPFGIVRGVDGQRVYGQITLLGSQKIIVTSYQGTLVAIDPGGQSQTIAEGQSFSGTLTSDTGGGKDVGATGVGSNGINWPHVLWVAVPPIVLTLVALRIHHKEVESCTVLHDCHKENGFF
jgi:hypothetical protein